ncbi:hypothetical protein [Aliiglaciecola lipolytica]|uniref:hypothetical protein n=1 Tax=Aliiglaciecola lipolytica TaxID=477689 RepID=UPI001C0927F5|nr:hypothetical protein [Aliiglaciecola lipolytica]MBU2877052.1 hypothetical protein [Aliiglaciecola lipolytica]
MNILHWLYIAVLLVPAIIRLVDKVASDTGGVVSRYSPLFVALILCLGVVGYVTRTPIFRRGFWLLWFWLLNIMLLSVLIYFIFTLLSNTVEIYVALCWFLLLIVWIAPAQRCIYLYVYKQKKLWR